ncbi:MAG: hypothetical protein IPK94_10055 [Saprospiraceae bacterium]|nr:hypothetical protein [Saprospiraceae bacterium]
MLKLPVVPPQPGWVTALKVGVVGVVGAALTVALRVPEVHGPNVAVTVAASWRGDCTT